MLRISIIGGSHWANCIAAHGLDRQFAATTFSCFREVLRAPWRLLSSETVLILGHGMPNSIKRLIWFMLFVLVWALGRRHLFLYWIGSEVLRPAAPWQDALYLWFAKRRRVHLLCGAPWFVEHLAERGLEVNCIPFPYDTSQAQAYAESWPEETSLIASTYLTPSHWDNSNGDWIVELCRLRPEVQWHIIGMSRDNAMGGLDQLDNVELFGWDSEPQRRISNCHMFLRLTRNDAYAGTVRDAQAMRRIVLFTKPMDDCIQVSESNFEPCRKIFLDIADAFFQGDAKQITALRSKGTRIPSIAQGAQRLSEFIKSYRT